MHKKLFTILPIISILFLYTPAFAQEEQLKDDIVILYTNDIHSHIDGPISYDTVAALKTELKTQYEHVFLVDAGDHVQGTAYGSHDKGETIINLMNSSGYDVAALGNHEFDYGMFNCMKNIDNAEFSYISSNFYHEENNVRKENVLDSFVTFDCGEETIAFVGITTPETLTQSTPAYFQDENGSYIYGIAGGENGSALYTDVQNAIDKAVDAGATKVIGLGHLGTDFSSIPWTSEETIAHTCGMDAFIDGHSHKIVEEELISDKEGHEVLLTQTGEYFSRIGMMIIDSETGDIDTDFIEYQELLAEDGETVTGYEFVSDLYPEKNIISDEKTKALKDSWLSVIDEQLNQMIGTTTVIFDNYDQDGNRLVRSQETNCGDFTADALYYLFDNMDFDVDAAIMNGGGIRNEAITGDISYLTCKDIHSFGNIACLQTITGQQLLDALEWGARYVNISEEGSFLQVSGITYKIDTTIMNTVPQDEDIMWAGPPTGEYRVHDVMIYNRETLSWEELDLNASYNLAGYNYTLRDLGGGFAMFKDAINILDYVMEDYMVVANYISGFENQTVEASNSPLALKYPGFTVDYSSVNGCGRIEIITK